MPVTTRSQFEQENHPPFNYTQLPSPTRRSKAPISNDSSSSNQSENSKATPWYKGGFLFSTFKTPKNIDSVSLTLTEQEKFQLLQEHFEHKDNQARLDKEHNQQRMDAARHMAYRGTFHEQPETSNHEHRSLFNGNNGNNMPPRSPPRPTFGMPSSPPRPPPSQHEAEADDEISSEDLMRFE